MGKQAPPGGRGEIEPPAGVVLGGWDTGIGVKAGRNGKRVAGVLREAIISAIHRYRQREHKRTTKGKELRWSLADLI